MGLSIVTVLYAGIGLLAAAGSIFISQNYFRQEDNRSFLLISRCDRGIYLVFTAYFGDQGAWRLETGAVILFAVFGILGLRLPVALIVGYSLHGVWDTLHEIHAHSGEIGRAHV